MRNIIMLFCDNCNVVTYFPEKHNNHELIEIKIMDNGTDIKDGDRAVKVGQNGLIILTFAEKPDIEKLREKDEPGGEWI